MTQQKFYQHVMRTKIGLSSKQLKDILFLIKTHKVRSKQSLIKLLKNLDEIAQKIGSRHYQKLLQLIEKKLPSMA